jgi:hypothetical protein
MSKIERYLRRGHKFVEGWLLPGAAAVVTAIGRQQIKDGIRGNVAEIGVHHGRLFILLYLLARDDENAIAIDLFNEQEKNIDQSGRGDLSRFLSNVRRYADDQRLIVHQGDSTELTSQRLLELSRGPLRLVSIDGGHTADITANDLGIVEGALAQGGVAILDDCFNEMWPGVAEGMFRYFQKQRGIVPFAIGGNKVLFTQSRFSDRYATALHPLSARAAAREFLGHSVLCLDFTPSQITERIGQIRAWKAVKDIPPVPMLRRLYRLGRSAVR